MTLLLTRLRFPWFTDALTCTCRKVKGVRREHDLFISLLFDEAQNAVGRHLSLTSRLTSEDNADYKVSPQFTNRNPRNLEHLNLARKREGWHFQSPRKDYYNKLEIFISNQHIEARVVHFTGITIVSASTKEWAIRKHLYSTSDVPSAETIGHVLAQRCLESGITKMYYDREKENEASEKMRALLGALEEADIPLWEPDVIKPVYKPGIDYEAPNRYAEKKKMKDDYQM